MIHLGVSYFLLFLKTVKVVSSVSHIWLNFCAQIISRLPLDAFSSNVIISLKSIKTIQVSLKSDKNNEYFTIMPTKLMTISRWIILCVTYLGENCNENQKIYKFNKLFRICVVHETDHNAKGRMRFAFWIYGVVFCTIYTAYFNFRAYYSVIRMRCLRN